MKLVIVEDDARYLAALCAVFRQAPDFEVVETFDDARTAVEAARAGRSWGLVLMDIELPGMSGVEATAQIKRWLPDTMVVMLTVFEDPATVLEAICAGADGYLLKKSGASELLEELRHIRGGGAPLTPRVAKSILAAVRTIAAAPRGSRSVAKDDALELSTREREVLRELVDGHSYKQVAAELDISIDTVRGHIRRLYRKLQVHSVAEAVTRALREGLV